MKTPKTAGKRAKKMLAKTSIEPTPALTPRQIQIMIRRCAGLTYKAIAAELGLSIRTVQHHIELAVHRLKCDTSLEATRKFQCMNCPRRTGRG